MTPATAPRPPAAARPVLPAEAPPAVEPVADQRVGREWRDLLAIGALAIAGLLVAAAPGALRVPIGLLAVVLVPGYSLVAALFPNDEQIDLLERLALSLGLSYALIAL